MGRRPLAKAKPRAVEDVLVDDPRAMLVTTPASYEVDHAEAHGAIVRLDVQVGDGSELVQRAKASLEEVAAKVVVRPAPKSKAPQPAAEAPPAQTAREAVRTLVAESAHPDKPALLAACERFLAQAGG